VKIHRPSLGAQVYTEARGLFEKALELDPNLALAWEGLSFIYFVASTRELTGISGPETSKLALEAAEKAVLLDPLSSNAHVVLGLAARWNGLNERAVSACEKALELNPNNDEAYLCASRAYYVLGRLEESIRMVEIAERLNPRFRPWRRDFYTGASRYFMGEYEAAVTDLKRAKADFPRHQSLTFHLVAALAMAGRNAEAIAMLDDYYQLAGRTRDSIAEIRETHQNGTPDFEMLAEGSRRAGMPEQ
jgi:tetratricopeptide (TPR) repeat protein